MDFTLGDSTVNLFNRARRWAANRIWSGLGRDLTIGDYIRSGYTSSGQIVNPRTILRHPAVWRGVDLISTSIARIPFDVFEEMPDGSRRSAIEHDARFLLKRQPNGVYSRFQLFKCWAVNALTHGDGFIWIERDPTYGTSPQKLWLLDSSNTSIANGKFGPQYMTNDANGQRRTLDAGDVLHLRGLGNDGFSGLPICSVLADAFGLGMTLQRYQNAFFENAGRPSLVIKLPPEVSTQEEIEEFRAAWGDVHNGGPENAFKPAMIRTGTEIIPLEGDKAIESLANLREHDLVTIANCLGIVPHRLGAKSVSVSYGSLEQENLSFLQDIDGWTTQGEQELSLKLLRTSEQRTHYIEGNREALVQSDSETKASLLAIYRRNGMMSDQEIRRKLNLPIDFEGTFWTEANLIERSIAIAKDINNDDREDVEKLSLKLTESTVGRLTRRASKSKKLNFILWREELGLLPGFDRIADRIQNTPIEKLQPAEIARELWKTT